jgi:putative transposase
MEAYRAVFSTTDKRGAEPKHCKRDIVNAVLYLNKTGCQWRMLPSDFPPWQTFMTTIVTGIDGGIWEKALEALNELL